MLWNGARLCANSHARVATSAKWKNKSYDELIDLSKEDQELTKYLSFLYQKFLEQYLDGQERRRRPILLATWPSLDLSRMRNPRIRDSIEF